MEVKRNRPVKIFEAVTAFGPYRKGDRLQPTGIYRDVLLRQGRIREVVGDDGATREAGSLANRMVPEPQQDLPLATRSSRRR